MYRRSRKDTSEEHSIIIIDKRKKKNPSKILNDISTKQDESIQNTNITDVNEIKDYQEESQINENKENRENIFLQKKVKREKINDKEDSKKDYSNKKSGKNQRHNITYINTDEDESDYEEESLREKTKTMNDKLEKKRQRTIYVNAHHQKLNVSDLKDIFKEYGNILKIKPHTKNSALIEFDDKRAGKEIMKNAKNIYFKDSPLSIKYADDIFTTTIIKKNEKEPIIMEEIEEENKNKKKKEFKETNKILREKISKKEEPKEEEENYIEIKEKIKEDNKENTTEEDLKKIIEEKKKNRNEIYNKENEIKSNLDYINEIVDNMESSNNKIFKALIQILKQNQNEIEQNKKSIDEKGKIIERMEKEIENLKISLKLIDAINNQSNIYYKRKIKYIIKNQILLLNTYKMLFMRKLANLLLVKIYNKYSNILGKGYIDKRTIIAISTNKKKLGGVDVDQINLVIDFLRFVWDKCSNIIHINDESFPLQKEIFFECLKPSKNISDKNIKNKKFLEVNEIIGLIFDTDNEENNKKVTHQLEDNNLVKAIKNYIYKKKDEDTSELKSSDLNFEKENLIIELSDSEEAFEAYKGYDESEIKKIINKDSQIFNIDTQIENLLKLISKNADGIRFMGDEYEKVNGKYFYELWLDTFNTETYKRELYYKKYFKYNKIGTLDAMAKLICKILKRKHFNLFTNDPQRIIKKIINPLP